MEVVYRSRWRYRVPLQRHKVCCVIHTMTRTLTTSRCAGSLLAIATAALIGITPTQAAPLYQWIDHEGVLTYSPTPPKDRSIQYSQVNDHHDQPSIAASAGTHTKTNTTAKVDHTHNTSAETAQETRLSLKPPAVTVPQESRLERRLRLAPKAPAIRPITQTPSTLRSNSAPVDLDTVRLTRRCHDLTNRITALEARLAVVKNIEQLNQSILLISDYQNMQEEHCR